MNDSRLILIRKNDRILTLLLEKGRLAEANAYSDQCSILGSVYAAKVMNTVPNIQAAFLEVEKNVKCFLSLERLKRPFLLNRPYDGRILPGDELLVQIDREAVKTKDPVATTELSFPGRYAVVLPSASVRLSFSNKLTPSVKEALLTGLKEQGIPDELEGLEVIIRTNAGELTNVTLLADEIRRLAAAAGHVLQTADKRSCFSCLYRPPAAWLVDIRDICHDRFEKIVTDDQELYIQIQQFLEQEYPEELPRLSFHNDPSISLESLYGLTNKMGEATEPRVWLKSGGYLVIEPTEALTVIDVNTGKFTGRKAVQDTFRLINREAAPEIARQLRLRNLSGIIIIDFINMEREEDRTQLLELLTSEIRHDSVRTKLIDMTPLGLVELTRKKIRRPLKEQLEDS